MASRRLDPIGPRRSRIRNQEPRRNDGCRGVATCCAAGDTEWESMVPREAAEIIKRRAFFGYTKPAMAASSIE